MSRRWFDIEAIHFTNRMRSVNHEKAAELAESIQEIGLMSLPAVRIANGIEIDGETCDHVPVLIYGRHRIRAFEILGRSSIECEVKDVDDDHAELMEIDENLKRADLSPAQEADHIRRRQVLWEKMHGSAKAVGARAANAVMGRGDATPNSGVASFVTDTAKATGKASSVVRQASARAKALGDDIQRVAGTSLDKGVEMDALVKMPVDERRAIIVRAEAGEQVSARPAQDPKDSQRTRFWRLWASLDEDVRQSIMADFQAGRIPAP